MCMKVCTLRRTKKQSSLAIANNKKSWPPGFSKPYMTAADIVFGFPEPFPFL